MQKELQDSLLKIVCGDNLRGASVIFIKTAGEIFSLGILSHTRKKGFLTFNPTIKNKSFSIFNMSGFLKHITLVNENEWHITCEKNKNKTFPKRLNKKTTKLSDRLTYWFGISIKDIGNLYKVLSEGDKESNIQMNYSGIPPSDSNRRLNNLSFLLQTNFEQALVQINNWQRTSEHFYHFEFYICEKDDEEFWNKEGEVGFFSPVIDHGIKVPVNILKFQKIGIHDKVIAMVSAQLPGTIAEPVRLWFKER